jgi:sugar O-acyltransferase (sialic acid O-acetyltransferase NeuD family)
VRAVTRAGTADYELIGVADDNPSTENLQRLSQGQIPYLGGVKKYFFDRASSSSVKFVLGIGSPEAKSRLAHILAELGYEAVSLIDPSSSLGSQVKIGAGCVIQSGARIGTDSRIGNHVYIGANATLGHDAQIGDYSSVFPQAAVAGDVVIEESVVVGSSSFVMQGIRIGAMSVIGASSCVTKSVAPAITMSGVPARQHGSTRLTWEYLNPVQWISKK